MFERAGVRTGTGPVRCLRNSIDPTLGNVDDERLEMQQRHLLTVNVFCTAH